MDEVWTAALLIASPFVGSFLGVLTTRLPEGAPVVVSRSRCEGCGRVLRAFEMMPLVSWLALRGCCARCGVRIGLLAPGMEAAALLIALWSALAAPPGLMLATAMLGWTLLALSAIDIRCFLLPDVLTLPLIVAGLAVGALTPGAVFIDHAVGAAVGGALLWAVSEFYLRVRGVDGLGLGDAKLFAAAGAWLGWVGLPSTLLISAGAGLAAGLAAALIRRQRLDMRAEIPFGPFLALGFWLTWLYGPVGL